MEHSKVMGRMLLNAKSTNFENPNAFNSVEQDCYEQDCYWPENKGNEQGSQDHLAEAFNFTVKVLF